MSVLILQATGSEGFDTYINSAMATTNYGTSTTLPIGYMAATGIQRALFRFDLSPILDATITQAEMELTVTTVADAGLPLNVARITKNWVEALTTWNRWAIGQNWDTAGGDYELSGSAGNLPTSLGAWTINSAALLALCRDAIASRAGVLDLILYRVTESLVDARAIVASGENATLASRPKLTINYDTRRRSGVVACMMAAALRGRRR